MSKERDFAFKMFNQNKAFSIEENEHTKEVHVCLNHDKLNYNERQKAMDYINRLLGLSL